ncbi:MAG: methionine gamma-lyase family protein [Defluviitaleaceae bacterium]|nr:methionine gamma-lyase family protein [Defluviitaleaceae bacterium]
MFYDYYVNQMGISPAVASYIKAAEAGLIKALSSRAELTAYNQLKVLQAMQASRLSDAHFTDSTGYGYHDTGRQVLEDIFTAIFKAEAALVRPQLISGTHALAAALFGNLRPGDVLLSPVGKPYDTLESVIGIRPTSGSLAEYGVEYKQVELTPGGKFDFDGIKEVLQGKTLAVKASNQSIDYNSNQPENCSGNMPVKMVTIQRSKGYAWRPSFTIDEIKQLITFIRTISPHTIILVDNCYGEFAEDMEPIEVGADIAAGSLIKNPGGGIAPGGGYIVGAAKYVEAAAERLTAPGLGSAVGPTFGMTRTLLQGLFLAPQTVGACITGAMLAAAVFDGLGYDVNPLPLAKRTDIVQAIKLGEPEKVLAYCKGIQKAAPVDSYVLPEPAPMPGYADGVVMAGGTFVQGSSIELSADAPLRPPYIVYHQGGLTEAHAKAGVVFALDALYRDGYVGL